MDAKSSTRIRTNTRQVEDLKSITFHLEDMRRRRTDLSVELRKQKRDDELMKRRNVDDASDSEDSSVQNSPRPAVSQPLLLH